MKYALVRLLGVLLLLPALLAGCGDSDSPTLPIDFASLTAIEITSNGSILIGSTKQFTAVGRFELEPAVTFSRDITDQVIWSSSDATVVSFSALPGEEGLATAETMGDVTVRAALDGLEDQVEVSVTSEITALTLESDSGALDPPVSLAPGTTLQLRAVGTLTGGGTQDLTQEVVWLSTNPAAATVGKTGEEAGLVAALDAGDTVISASAGGQVAEVEITVPAAVISSLEVAPPTSTLAPDTTVQLVATGVFTDGSRQDLTDQVAWTIEDTGVATINTTTVPGLVTARAAGTTTATASFRGVSDGADITVTAETTLTDLQVSGPDGTQQGTIIVGEAIQLTATGIFADGNNQDLTGDVTWTTSDVSVATVNPHAGQEGVVVGQAAGTAEIRATYPSGAGTADLTDTFTVTVTE